MHWLSKARGVCKKCIFLEHLYSDSNFTNLYQSYLFTLVFAWKHWIDTNIKLNIGIQIKKRNSIQFSLIEGFWWMLLNERAFALQYNIVINTSLLLLITIITAIICPVFVTYAPFMTIYSFENVIFHWRTHRYSVNYSYSMDFNVGTPYTFIQRILIFESSERKKTCFHSGNNAWNVFQQGI